MNKRSAAIVAAGLVAVLTLGGFAYSRGLTGLGVSVATAGEQVSHLKPIVRTHTKWVVVHRSAPAPAPRIVYSPSISSSLAASGAQDQSGSDDGMYDDQGENDEYEGQEDQNDQQEQEDQSGDRYEGDDD